MMIDINKVGATAFVIAAIRSMEKDQPRPLFQRPLRPTGSSTTAHGQWPGNSTRRSPRRRPWFAFARSTLAGSSSAESRTVARQVVLLGGGLDMRAPLLAAPGVTFFEVDQKAVLEYKRTVLDQHGIDMAPSVYGNYLEVDVPDGLAENGFDLDAPTLIVWEGNTMYLPTVSIMPFLNRLGDAISTFRIAFDYFALDLANREESSGKDLTRDRGSRGRDGGVIPDRVP